MKTIYGTNEVLTDTARIAALGIFDGVHRGHQRILGEVITWARAEGAEATVITFERHPQALLGKTAPPCITSLEHRLVLFARLGLDLCVVLPFDENLARLEPDEFARKILHQYLHTRGIVMGFDQHFGRGGRGDGAYMRRLGEVLGFSVRTLEPVMARGQPISSTALRQAIQRCDLAYATEILGRPPSLLGTVVRGGGRGRALGFPTANLNLHHEVCPPDGVYLTRALVRDTWYPSLTHIGKRPTYLHEDRAFAQTHTVETYLHGFSGELYGEDIEVQLLERIRDVLALPRLEDLRLQIVRDVEHMRRAITAGRL